MPELVLFQPPGRPWGSPNASPFCSKLETYLRMSDTPYRIEPFNFRKAPKGKMPYVELDGSLLGDSQLIIEELERRRQPALDHGITPRERAEGHLVRRTLEEALYFVSLYMRWVVDDGYRTLTATLAKTVPAPWIVLPMLRNGMRKKLVAQGTGRHPVADLVQMGTADFGAVAEMLGDRKFLLGDQPRTADAALYAFVESALAFPLESPIKTAVEGHANLVAYRKRVRERWWQDLDAATPPTA